MNLLKHFLLGSIFFVFSSAVFGLQSTLEGTVLSEDGIPLSGAHVYLEEGKWAISNEFGNFTISSISKGSYDITISRIGFREHSQPLVIDRDRTYSIEVFLKEKVYKDSPVVVTASRTKKELEDVSVPISVVQKEEIQSSGSLRLSDILDEQIGLNTVSNHGTGIQLQGFDPEYTLILIDNQPVIGRTAGTLDLNRLSVGNIEQIEVVKGPSSALWGSDALAGVINIITDKGGDPFGLNVSARYGSNSTIDGSTNLTFKKEHLTGRFFSNVNTSGGYDLDETTLAPTIPEYQNYTFSGGFDYRISRNFSLSFDSRYYRENQQYEDQIDNSLLNGDEFQEDYSVAPGALVTLGKNQLIEATAFLSRFRSQSDLDYVSNGESYFSDSFDQTLNKFEIKSSTFWSDAHTTVAGLGMNREDLTAEIYADIPYFDSYFAFGQHEWSISQKLSFTGGFRFDDHSEYQSQLSPKFSGLYKPNDIIHFRASLGGGFKAPDFRQLFLNFTNPIAGYSVYGSSTVVKGINTLETNNQIEELYLDPSTITDIQAEHSFAYNAGLDLFPFEGVQLKLNLFRNNVSDLIETQRIALKTNGQAVFSYINLNKIYTQGAETEIRIKPVGLSGFSASLGYQYLDAQREITRQFDNVVNGQVISVTTKEFVPMFNRSKHTGNLKLFYVFEALDMDASLRIQYRGKYGFADVNANNLVDTNEYSEAYTLVNTSVSKTFFDRYRLQFGINNIGNYQSALYLPSNPGITFYSQISIKIH